MKLLKESTTMIGRRNAERKAHAHSCAQCLCGMLLATILVGCSSGSANIPVSSASGPQLYMAPVVGGNSNSSTAHLATYALDDAAKTYVQNTYAFTDTQSGARVNFSGTFPTPSLQRGLLGLDMTYAYGSSNGNNGGITYNPPQLNGWAVELPGQSGGLVNLLGQTFVPLVPSVTCPAMTTPQSFLFLTLPAPLVTTGTSRLAWNPQLETAYGSVDIGATGSTVALSNIRQYTLSSGSVSGAPTSIAGACASGVFGNAVSIPDQVTISNPGGGETETPQALMGIGPSGLLVEDNGAGASSPALGSNGNLAYQNALGAGTGAIGLPKPPSALDTTSAPNSLLSAQYLGSFYGAGSVSSSGGFATVASFGFPSALQSSCSVFAAQIGPLVNGIYGGDFPVDTTPNLPTTGVPNPSLPSVQSNGGYGNCDLAIDLGTQSSVGLFPAATVYVGSNFAANKTGATYHFPAVAIAGQLNGKYAIFLIGQDSTGSPKQAWGIYLLQSN